MSTATLTTPAPATVAASAAIFAMVLAAAQEEYREEAQPLAARADGAWD